MRVKIILEKKKNFWNVNIAEKANGFLYFIIVIKIMIYWKEKVLFIYNKSFLRKKKKTKEINEKQILNKLKGVCFTFIIYNY